MFIHESIIFERHRGLYLLHSALLIKIPYFFRNLIFSQFSFSNTSSLWALKRFSRSIAELLSFNFYHLFSIFLLAPEAKLLFFFLLDHIKSICDLILAYQHFTPLLPVLRIVQTFWADYQELNSVSFLDTFFILRIPLFPFQYALPKLLYRCNYLQS